MTGFAAQHVVGNGMHVSTTLTRRERVFDTESEAGSQRAHNKEVECIFYPACGPATKHSLLTFCLKNR
jgi:hypothetical protein